MIAMGADEISVFGRNAGVFTNLFDDNHTGTGSPMLSGQVCDQSVRASIKLADFCNSVGF
jgi:hypothetical protein